MSSFKPGDWIRSTRYLNLSPVQITSIYESNTRPGTLGLKSKGTVLYSDEAKHWQPKVGEWVVIADDITPDLYAVFQFNNHSTDRQILPLVFLQSLKDNS